MRGVDDAWSLTVDAWDGFALAGAFTHSAFVRLALAVIGVAPSVLYAGSPTFVAPFGVVLDCCDASVAPWPRVAIGDDMTFVAFVDYDH